MFELPHTIVGATIASKISNPLLSLPLAFLSHLLLDLLPHWNPHIYAEKMAQGKVSKKSILICFVDSGMALIVGLFLAFSFWPDISRVVIILLGCFLAVLMDLIEMPFFFFGWNHPYILKLIAFQRKIQWNVSIVPGLLTQVVFLFILFLILR